MTVNVFQALVQLKRRSQHQGVLQASIGKSDPFVNRFLIDQARTNAFDHELMPTEPSDCSRIFFS
jgi:hypothetical protein